MTGIETIITNAAAPTLVVFLFIGYLQRRDSDFTAILRDIRDSNIALKDAIHEQSNAINDQKGMIEQMYVELLRKTKIIRAYKGK